MSCPKCEPTQRSRMPWLLLTLALVATIYVAAHPKAKAELPESANAQTSAAKAHGSAQR